MLTDAELENIELDAKEGMKEAKYQMLSKWSAADPSAATVLCLYNALKDASRMDIANNVFGMFKTLSTVTLT